jgi:hypothetical protein
MGRGRLVAELAEELKGGHGGGQPVILEETFHSGKRRVVVIWDKWEAVPTEERISTIHQAYAQVESSNYCDSITLADGFTVPEAQSLGLLPFSIIPALRKGDPVTWPQCKTAMVAEGASTLLDQERPQLRFASREEAEAAVARLTERLPGSGDVWVIAEEVGKVPDWVPE